jgi:hypothetical protein
MKAYRHNLKALLLLCMFSAGAMATGCPGGKTDSGANSAGKPGVKPAQRIAAGEYPQAALQYVLDALKQPTEGYPALAYTWTVVAQLDQLGENKLAPQISAEIAKQVQGFSGQPPIDLVAAWLAVQPEAATEFIRTQAKASDWSFISAYWFHPELARPLLADPATRILAPRAIADKRSEVPKRWLELQSGWGVVTPADEQLLIAISERQGDPGNTLRAAGWLLRLDPDSKRFVDYLNLGIGRIAPGEIGVTMGATEGAKISRHEQLAEAFVPLAAKTPLKKDKEAKTPAELHFVAYALTYLPGEQASLMRRKMLDAQDPLIQWQARLGELLHGDPQPWDDAIKAEGLAGKEWWLALERIEEPSVLLVPTLQQMAESEDASLRLRAAAFLGKFGWNSRLKEALDLVDKLAADDVAEVRTAAWYSAGRIGAGDPLPVVNDSAETPEVRLAAAYAALMQGQGGTPESKWRAAAAEEATAAVAENRAADNQPADDTPATEGGE